jgi:hypothetical protein
VEFQAKVSLCAFALPLGALAVPQRQLQRSQEQHVVSLWDPGERRTAPPESDRVGGCVLGAGGGGDAIMYRMSFCIKAAAPYDMQSGLNRRVLKIRATNRIPH